MEKNVYLFKILIKKIKYLLNFYIILLIIIDFLSKTLIIKNIKLYECFYINNYINFIYIRNYGIILEFLKNKKIIIYFFTVIIILILFYIKHLLKNKNIYLSYNLIISGILGNLIDRIYHGFVIDFINLHIFNYQFPIFNFADILIFIGFIFILKNNIFFIYNL
ncbi:signal peptidase II [Enterobacteriaceae endosymbiont of Donacia cincticornis]|uniref:signal peptidase II n=1 Tax=Enterobacteriaceae endosymbiont of Donacia cincticornis TaxID=2675773 RepID=UPI0014494679|nr:signal peptidase II [Enterobacteriaceae endosymbiont of Donacia cincticornis]QJC35963.1 signal peptidase II [Enterobacteriaceae endosymbiont of Donacia cincticornis]